MAKTAESFCGSIARPDEEITYLKNVTSAASVQNFITDSVTIRAARDKGFGMKFLPYIILILSLLRICSTKEVPEGLEGGINDVQIHRLHVNAVITSRFSRTIITSQASNHANVSKEISFDVELPKEAFISNFSMTIDGKTYAGVVKEKEIAHKVYTDAISRGQSAGIVKASGRLLERFKVEVSLSPRSEIIFQLTYEELLRRKLGQYQILLKVQPKQLVEDFQIEVLINETRAISFLDAEGTFLTNDLKLMVEKSYSGNKGHVLFKPPLDTQRSCPVCTSTVLDGEFTVKYDVDRSHSGDIQVVNGYFVHFFAPVNLPQIPKRVVFVIDVSGSMSGRKIQQTREALLRILDDLHPDDYFNLIIFSSIAAPWKKSLVRAGKVNVENAKKHVRTLQANGGTNLNEAVLSAVSLLLQNKPTGKSESTKAPMIILLTDGDPTVGEVKTAQIKANVKQAINGQLSLYCLGFGRDLDYSFLQTLALENGGVARRIYEDSDADLQLQGFYKEVAQPLLTNVQVVYPEHAVSHLTKSTFQRYYGGSEIIIAGIITDNELTELPSEITAQGARDRLSFNASSLVGLQQDYIFGEYTERLWAYLTILQLLEEQIVAEGEHKEHLKAQALSLSLKYNFVTPLSSMVVTKPERKGNQSVVAEKMNEEEEVETGTLEEDSMCD
ncbi:inter-alpha-trypsin inhibitor heavy chain H3-like [Rhinophrynus dorsalis]